MHRILALALALATAACGGTHGTPDGGMSTCGGDTRAVAYTAGMSVTGKSGVLKVRLVKSEPGPPLKGDNRWLLEVSDASSGAPVEPMKLSVDPFMPDHGHGTPVVAVVTAMGGGTYKVDQVNLFMAGLWEVKVNMTTSDGKVDQAVFPFCIEG